MSIVVEKELPKGWRISSLDNFTKIIFGQSPPSSSYNTVGNGLPFYQGKAEFGTLYPIVKKWCSEPERISEKNDILLCVRAGVGATNLNPQKSCIGRGLASIHPLCHVPNFYILYFFYFIEPILTGSGRGTTITGITSNQLKNLKIPVPPLNEQKRIVSKIEELFSLVDSAKDTLEKTKVLLKQYRQSILKHAFEGKLTEEWRKHNPTKLDSILSLLDSKEIAELKENLEIDIPKEWKIANVGIIAKSIQYGTSEKADKNFNGIAVLRMGNIDDGKLNFDDLKYYPDNWKDSKKFLLDDGDVLFNRTNSAELVGKTAVYRKFHPPAVFAGYLIRVKIIDGVYLPLLLSHFINSIFGKLYIKKVVSQQVGQANVNSKKLSDMSIPLMSLEEQKEILSKIEESFSLIEKNEILIEQLLIQYKQIKNSILKHAFEGKLVPQDPNDEPAEVLLQRIREEKNGK